MNLKWPGVVQKKGTLKRLETFEDDIRPVVEYTHTFVFITPEGRADERQDLFYTALAPTPEEAELSAQLVYLRAVECRHQMTKKSPRLMECVSCGIQQRLVPRATMYDYGDKEQGTEGRAPAKPEQATAKEQPKEKRGWSLRSIFKKP